MVRLTFLLGGAAFLAGLVLLVLLVAKDGINWPPTRRGEAVALLTAVVFLIGGAVLCALGDIAKTLRDQREPQAR
jgi:hypothetical protein